MAMTHRQFSTELKLGIVEAYLAGVDSLNGLATKAGVDHSLARNGLIDNFTPAERRIPRTVPSASSRCRGMTTA
jgi:transposase-like protein